MTKLTDLEREALRGIYRSEYHDVGRPAIWSFSVEYNCDERITCKNVGGVIGSLAKKGVVSCNQGERADDDTITVTAAGETLAIELGIADENGSVLR